MDDEEGTRVVIASITGFRFSGGKEFDFGCTTRVGLVNYGRTYCSIYSKKIGEM